MNKTNLYQVWINMRQRCNNPKAPEYSRYGARGIAVCSEWNSYIAFQSWAMTHGYSMDEGLSIDRIDNDAGYSPDNCKWSTPQEQAINRRGIKLTREQVLAIREADGTMRTIAKDYDVSKSLVSAIKQGKTWSHI